MSGVGKMGFGSKSVTLYDYLLRFLLVIFPVLPVNYYIGSFNYSNVCAILILVVFILKHRDLKIKQLWRYNCLFWIFMLIHTVQILITGTFITGISYFISHIVVCFVCIDYLSDEKRLMELIDGIVLVGGILGIVGVIEALSGQYLIQGDLLNAQGGVRYGFLRCTTTFGHPIGFGLFQAIVALLAFYRISCLKKGNKRNFLRVCYIIALISCFLSVSRLAICMLLACQVVFALKMGVNKVVRYLLIVLLGIFGLIVLSETLGYSFMANLVLDFVAGFREMFLGESSSKSDAIGFGNRLDLYEWVINDVGNQWLFGKGADAEFAYEMYEWFTKTSIEVQYLNIYFNFGIVGLGTLVLSYVGTLFYFIRSKKTSLKCEGKISFRTFLIVVIFAYYICLFGVQETDTGRIYCLLVSMGIAYNRIVRKKCI